MHFLWNLKSHRLKSSPTIYWAKWASICPSILKNKKVLAILKFEKRLKSQISVTFFSTKAMIFLQNDFFTFYFFGIFISLNCDYELGISYGIRLSNMTRVKLCFVKFALNNFTVAESIATLVNIICDQVFIVERFRNFTAR